MRLPLPLPDGDAAALSEGESAAPDCDGEREGVGGGKKVTFCKEGDGGEKRKGWKEEGFHLHLSRHALAAGATPASAPTSRSHSSAA